MYYIPANDAVGKLILRVTIGVLVLLHGIAKVIGGVEGIAGRLESVGLPGFIAYGVYLGEVMAPILMIVGFYARAGALLVALTMVVAIALVHSSELFLFTRTGGFQLELQYSYLFGAIAAMLLGPGRYAINDK